jgi:hypothetical protein
MKRLLLLTLLISLASITAFAQKPIRCRAPKFVKPANQYRGDVKHRARGAETGQSISVSDMYRFPDVAVDAVNAPENKHRAMPGSNETETFTLDALLQQAKVEGNDCEIHLEFSQTAGAQTRRVIVEVPPDADVHSDYQTILRLIHSRFPKVKVLGPDVPFRFAKPVHMKITGLGFFDGVHKHFAQTEGGNGGHGSQAVQTFWELHPAWNVQVLTP